MNTETPSDADLLRRFCGAGDEAAFRTLAGRYSGLVYHTALRSTGDAELARDVCQGVFLVLARKAARLDASGGLAGWLHRATVLEARSAVQREHRRHRALRALETAMNDDTNSPADAALHPALPHLDSAMDRLPGADREVLLAHFYQGWTYGEIARRRNETEAAVQRRASRAVEKLSAALRRAGVTVPLAALTMGLSAVLQLPAPAGVVPALPATAAAVPAAQITWFGKAAALVAAGALSGAASYALTDDPAPAAAVASARADSADESQVTREPALAALLPPTGPRDTWQAIAQRALEAKGHTRSDTANARAAWHLKALSMEELKLALHWAKALPDSETGAIMGAIILSLRAREDPAAAWSEQCQLFDSVDDFREPTLVQSGERIARLLWQRDPAACIARLPSLEKAQQLQEGAENAAREIMSTQEGRENVCRKIEQTQDAVLREQAADFAASAGKPAAMVPWLAGLAFAENEAIRVPVALLVSRPPHHEAWDAALTSWLGSLPAARAEGVRGAIVAELLKAPEARRLEFSRSLTDPVLRRAVQESL